MKFEHIETRRDGKENPFLELFHDKMKKNPKFLGCGILVCDINDKE